MLKINIVCAGKADKMFAAAIEEYLKRARTFFNLEIDEVSDEAVRSEGEVARAVAKESAALLARARGHIILLDIGGKAYGSAEIARKLESLSLTNPTVSFVIGGSYGVSAELK
ncbi:MAG: 23S rRNA (pseudouridine(1915)-N(3))-methyltransferase RlmH, partial [Firmicutes bacterium]|nr:23S rRNA (pseudouridine(1915)-N(3))-methyltransferase RlmH [Bacillota bacterium]